MTYSKSSQRKNQTKIAMIVQNVKNTEFKKIIDLTRARTISEEINKEWLRLEGRYRSRLANNKKFNLHLAAEYEAQRQIAFCLMSLLNGKMLDFLEGIL